MRWTSILPLLALLVLPSFTYAQNEVVESSQEMEATDFVIGLHAFNRQIMDALQQQPTRRVMVLPFSCEECEAGKLPAYISEQLITALAASRNYEIVDSAPLEALIAAGGIDPLMLGSSPEFQQASQSYANISVVVGKITPLRTRYGVMARLFNGENGRLAGGAQVYLAAADEIATLNGLEPAAEPEENTPQSDDSDQLAEEAESVKPETVDAEQPAEQQEEAQREDYTAAPANLEGRSDQSIYDEAYADYSAGRFTRAVMLFDYIINKYTESPLADNALYWLAECHYARKSWSEALAGFHRVLNEYPFGNKVPAALLKVAYTEEKLGRLAESTAALEELISRFENSPEAEMGKRKLQILRAAQQ